MEDKLLIFYCFSLLSMLLVYQKSWLEIAFT